MAHRPTGCEGLDHKLIGYMQKKGMHPSDLEMLPAGRGFLFVEFGGDTIDEAEGKARAVLRLS